MKERSANNSGKYVSVHLRFEEDMVAFSCCIYDGGKQEKIDMDAARKRGWKGKFTKPGRVICPGAIRLNGKCPLTPLEVGLMLRGMGFDNSTSIYLASVRIYDSERNMAPLLEMFPLLRTKEMLASAEELAPFQIFVIIQNENCFIGLLMDWLMLKVEFHLQIQTQKYIMSFLVVLVGKFGSIKNVDLI